MVFHINVKTILLYTHALLSRRVRSFFRFTFINSIPCVCESHSLCVCEKKMLFQDWVDAQSYLSLTIAIFLISNLDSN